MVVLHCNGRIHVYGNAHLITSMYESCANTLARTHTHIHTHTHTHIHWYICFLHQSCHFLEALADGVFWNLPSSEVTFDVMPSMVAKPVPPRPIFRTWTAKSHSERNPESTAAGCWKECLSRRFLRNTYIPQPQQNLHFEMTSNTVQAIRSQGAPNRRCRKFPESVWLRLILLPVFIMYNTCLCVW
jgi:hypothetical protein